MESNGLGYTSEPVSVAACDTLLKTNHKYQIQIHEKKLDMGKIL